MVRKFLYVFLLSFIFIINSNVFALTPTNSMNTEIMEEILEYALNVQEEIYPSSSVEARKTVIQNIINNVNLDNLVALFIENIGVQKTNIEHLENLICVISADSTNLKLTFFPINNTASSEFLHLNIRESYYANNGYYNMQIRTINDSNEFTNEATYILTINQDGTVSFNENGTSWAPDLRYATQRQTTEGSSVVDIPGLLGFGMASSFRGYLTETSSYQWYLTSDWLEIRKDEPSGGESGDTGGSESGDISTSGDYDGILDNISGGISDINNNLENLENTIASGNQEIVNEVEEIKDFLSGDATIKEDEFLEIFPEVDIDDPSEDFFSWIFSQIENVFLNTEPQTFNFTLFTGKEYIISTEQIKTPENAIKTLISLSISFSIFYWILKDVRKTINKIKEGNIEALATEDVTADMV